MRSKTIFAKMVSWAALFICMASGVLARGGEQERPASRYEDLLALFEEWRNFQKPPLVNGVFDYSAQTMAKQHRELAEYQKRLAAIDTSGWPISQRVDYHIVKAEMNGLDFDHRVRKPWVNNPAFYVMIIPEQSDTPAREGPTIHGAIDLWTYSFPLTAPKAAQLAAQIRTIQPALARAQINLTGNGRDLWIAGMRRLKQQSADLQELANKVGNTHKPLLQEIDAARRATDAICVWLEKEAPGKNGPSGVGIENYNWYLHNVQLVPFTWQEEVTIMHRELARAYTALRLEENRNRKLPQLASIASAEEYDRRLNEAVTEYMAFLRDEEIVSIRDYMDVALRERVGKFSPAQGGRRSFFAEVNYRDPVVMRTHGYHWFDLARMQHEPHASPIRRVPLLYNIFVSRAEGLATGVEEMMMHAGLFDERPRARELIWILLAQRAARALGGLHMHSNEWTMAQAIAFASKWTPRGWLAQDGNLVWFEQHLYLQQPMYGSSYITGKIQIEQLIAERSRQLGEAFTLKRFMDELNAAGVIPVSLIRWEMMGEADEFNPWSVATH